MVVSHVTPIKMLLMQALDAPLLSMLRLHLDTASVSRVDYFPNGASSVRLVNDTSHLRLRRPARARRWPRPGSTGTDSSP